MSGVVKRGYKQTEVGVIPEDWEVKSLKELTDSTRPISYGIVQTGPSVPNGVRCLRVLDINDGRINESDLITTTKAISASYSRTILRVGDLVMPLRGKVGDVGLIGSALAGANLTRGVALIAVQNASPIFCQSAIAAARKRLEGAMNGSALQEIPIATLRAFKLSLPPLPEQRAIADALSDVDALLGALDRLIAKKRDLKQAAMQQLLTGQTRLPGFRSEWEVSSVGREFDIKLGKMLDAEKNTGEPKPYIGNASVQWGEIDVSDLPTVPMSRSDVEAYRLRKGDLLVCEGGEVGRAAIWEAPIDECYYQKALHRLRPVRGFNPRLMAAQLRLWADRGELGNFVTQTSIAHLPREKFMLIPLRVPPLAEQTAIANVLSEMDAELIALTQRREKTQALKQGMMQELLTGRTRLV